MLMFSTVVVPTATVYPDSDKVGIWTGDRTASGLSSGRRRTRPVLSADDGPDWYFRWARSRDRFRLASRSVVERIGCRAAFLSGRR